MTYLFIINLSNMRTLLYEALNTVNEKLMAPLYKKIGKSLYVVGTKLEG